jgi:hypothetical protein
VAEKPKDCGREWLRTLDQKEVVEAKDWLRILDRKEVMQELRLARNGYEETV